MTDRILLTDAYSTTNIGDAELVLRSIQAVSTRYRVSAVLATDPQSFRSHPRFQGLGLKFAASPTSRLGLTEPSRLRRMIFLARTTAASAVLIFSSILPVKPTIRCSVARLFNPVVGLDWYTQLLSVDRVAAVGGGYLGDRYLRRTVVSLGYLWCSVRMGRMVETMPISISSADRLLTRIAIRKLGSSIRWRSREDVTSRILSLCGVDYKYVPDLAWWNANENEMEYDVNPSKAELMVAPVGSSFYKFSDQSAVLMKEISAHVDRLSSQGRIVEMHLVPMHSYSRFLGDGSDDKVCEDLASRCASLWPDMEIVIDWPVEYADVIGIASRASASVCERMHAALASMTQGTITTIIGYEPKHIGIVRTAKVRYETDGDVVRISDSLEIVARARVQRELLEQEFSSDVEKVESNANPAHK